MSRVSSLVLGAVVVGTLVSGCQASLSVKSKNRFVEDNVTKTDTADWAGQAIEIKSDGVGIAVNGGVTVVASPSTTKVTATARMLAQAVPEEKDNADQSISEAKDTFTITSDASTITVTCGHGGTHGSSNGGESGCELLTIQVPAGLVDANDAANNKPLQLTKVLSGNGTLTLSLGNAALVSNVGANANGGAIDATLPGTNDAMKGANVSLVTEKSDDITIRLPSDFATDDLILQADADKIDLGPFSDAKNGQGAGGRGTAGTGLASLKATSKDFAGSTGAITLASR